MPNLPLTGIHVIELGQVLAGPFAGAILADLGADVVKVERPEGGDDARHMGPAFRHGEAMNFHLFNRGKRSVSIDLKTPLGIAQLEALVAQADILVHNLRPGVPAQLGIDGASLCARYPRLVYCEMGAFGHTGALREAPGYEPLIQAFSGLSSINGDPLGPPVRIGASVCDQGTGMWTVIGALALLQRRQVTGRGGIVNTSLLETALVWAGQKIDGYVNEGREPERHASGHPAFVPYEAFNASDGPFLICVGNDRLFAKFSSVLGRPKWVDDPRYRTNRKRLANKAVLIGEINAILAGRTREQWLGALSDAGVPCAPILTIPEVLREPQVAALGLRQPVPDEDFSLIGLPISFDGERPPVRAGAPRLGEHNAELGLPPRG